MFSNSVGTLRGGFPDARVSPAVPGPGGPHNGLEVRQLRGPAELARRQGGIGNELGRIARPPQGVRNFKGLAGLRRYGVEDRLNGEPAAGAEVEGAAGVAIKQSPQGGDVRRREV